MGVRPSPAPALFLDRDGVINVDQGYTHRVADFEFLPGIFELVRLARGLGMRVVVVTNQAGIGRGLYTEADFATLTQWMCARFADAGAAIDRVYHCPTHPTEGIGAYRVESFMRKPNPGMLLVARDELGLDMARSLLLGDKIGDIQAGQAAGVGLGLLLTTTAPLLPAGTETVASLAEAAARLRSFHAAFEGTFEAPGPAGYTANP
jgi:D-glycero-D-manno-heptose 1,7-bisphosphate phosphatase